MLTGLNLKRVAGFVLPLAVGGSVLAVRAASASNVAAGAPAVVCTSTTAGVTTTTSGATTTTTGATTTTGLPITLPGSTSTTAGTTTTECTSTTVPPNCPTTSTVRGATTSLAATTSTGITLPVGGTTTGPTTTTVCETTTAPQHEVRITSIASNHVAGGAVTIAGTAAGGSAIVLGGRDPKNGTHVLGSTKASSGGMWNVHLAHGVLYNTVLQASSGAQKSNKVSVTVHQVLRITSDKLVGQGANGFQYKLAGSSTSRIPGEVITVTVNGKVVGKGKMRSNGTFTVHFIVKSKSQKLTLHGSGKSGSGVEYTLPAHRAFRV